MSILSRFLGRAKARDQPARLYVSGRPVSETHGDWSMKSSEAIYAAVSRIANTIAAMPVRLYKGNEIAEGDPLDALLSFRPNACMTPFTFRQTMEANRNAEGSAYAFIRPTLDDTGVASLDVLDPLRVRPIRIAETGEIWYELTPDSGERLTVHASRMICLTHMSANGEKGIRPIDVLRGTLTYDKNVKEYSVRQLAGVNSGVVLTVPGVGLDEKRKQNVVAQFLENYDKSAGRIIVLEGGITTSTFQNSPIDAKVLDEERITRNRVATVFNIPPHMLGDYSDTSYSTAEQSMQEYLTLTILPIMIQWENELDRKLLTRKLHAAGYHYRFDADALKRADTAATSDMYQKAVRSAWMTPNEIRTREGKAAVPYGDELMVSKDLVPLRVLLTQPPDIQ